MFGMDWGPYSLASPSVVCAGKKTKQNIYRLIANNSQMWLAARKLKEVNEDERNESICEKKDVSILRHHVWM